MRNLNQLIFLISIIAPSYLWAIETSGDIRYRSEFFKNTNLYETRRAMQGSTQFQHFLRADLELDHAWEMNTAKIELRGAHVFGDADRAQNIGDDIGLHQAYIELKEFVHPKINFRVGRQELSFGRELLVGRNDWDNQGHSFDALRFYSDNANWDIDAFFSIYKDDPLNVGEVSFSGINFEHTTVFKTINEIYFFHLYVPENEFHLPQLSGIKQKINHIGTRMEGKLTSEWFYHWSLDYQFGDTVIMNSDLDHRAYSVFANIDYFINHKIFRNIGFEFNISSGDKLSSTSKEETYTPLFASDHYHNGALDWFGMMNSKTFTLYLFYDIMEKIESSIEFHKFFLHSNGSAWYLGDQSPAWWLGNNLQMGWPTNNFSSKDAGFEIDLGWSIKDKHNRKYHLGYSLFLPGDLFSEPVSPWSEDKNVHWAYFQTELSF